MSGSSRAWPRAAWLGPVVFGLGCAAAPGPAAPAAPVAIPAGNVLVGAPFLPAPTVRALPGLVAEADEAPPAAPSGSAPGWLGVALSRAEGDPAGVLITRVLRGSPAAQQGLETGDRVLSVNDQPVNDPEDLSRRVAAFGRGGRVSFAVLRAGQHRLLAVQLGENPGFEGQLRMGFVGAPAPELEGVRVAQGSLEPRLRSLSGRVVVLEFWATWCGACRALMPTLNGWHERYRAEGATVVSVTMDEVDKAASDAHQLGMEYAVLSDPEGNVVRSYQAFALPTLFVIDRAGVVRDVAVGYDETRLAELRRTIETLLGES